MFDDLDGLDPAAHKQSSLQRIDLRYGYPCGSARATAKFAMAKTDDRLQPTPSTIKKLFAWSGNQCAIPDCKNELVDDGGTMLGKIAHIHAANEGGARFDADLDEDARRAFENLFLVCGPHHDIIDGRNREAEFPADLLRDHKRRHESRFQRAEHEFLERYTDKTRDAKPTYPVTLDALADALKTEEMRDCPDDIKGISEFIEKLARLPRATRTFAIELAARMRDHGSSNRLPVDDVEEAFEISTADLKRQLDILEHHGLGDADDHFGQWVGRLYERDPGETLSSRYWSFVRQPAATGRSCYLN